MTAEKSEKAQMNQDTSAGLLQQLYAQLQAKQGIPELAAAYVAAWGEIPNVTKNANNPHFGNDYADLAAVLAVIKPVFARHALALFQAPGPMRDDKITLVSTLIHKSGQNIQITTELPIGNKPTAQAAGSAYTYARRYVGQAIGGMAPVDDDGSAASEIVEAPPKAKKPKKEEEPATEGSYAAMKAELEARIAAATDKGHLETTCKAEVQAANDKDLAETYVAKLRSFKKVAK